MALFKSFKGKYQIYPRNNSFNDVVKGKTMGLNIRNLNSYDLIIFDIEISYVLKTIKINPIPWRMSKTKPGFLNEWKNIISPIEPSVKAGLNTGILFFDAQ